MKTALIIMVMSLLGFGKGTNNSTLFLDEIGELPLDLQVKLLRVLQEKEIERGICNCRIPIVHRSCKML